jgi:hypothetical protein
LGVLAISAKLLEAPELPAFGTSSWEEAVKKKKKMISLSFNLSFFLSIFLTFFLSF